ncbi:MAG: GNAT family N-acetyltransferase [Chloroflexi bacterium]|nr:GNAT family N-acetyltransferase [Chloroflexota bacterium]MCH8235925.1 GNAT family N-acetyltransferase [Chloroflexota bacterium]MCH8816276.1 GNAT family N-acetyltransferase [Chloroflexota bacterium]
MGELVVLRAKKFSDVDRDYSWRSDPELAELDATSPIRLSLDEYGRHYRDEIDFPSPWSARYAIETHDKTHIGNAMYYDIDRSKSQCELGIMIGNRDYWGRGYGTDAVITMLRAIFEEAGLERVYLHTLNFNKRAQRSFTKAGFKDLETVRRDRRDFIKMEALREPWFHEFGGPPETKTEAEHADQEPRVDGVMIDESGSPAQSRRTPEAPGSA